MKNYVLFLAAALLISAAPAYYAFQAHAEETPVSQETSQAPDAESADQIEPAAGEAMDESMESAE